MKENFDNHNQENEYIPNKIKGNINSLGEVTEALESAVSTLKDLEYARIHSLLMNMEMRFPKDGLDFYKAKKQFEINMIKQALKRTGGHQTKAAKLLKINVTTLNNMIKKYNII